MTPDRWQKTKSIVNDALEREPTQREAFIASACGDDHELLAEVARLLQQAGHDSSFLKPLTAQAMAAAMGTAEPQELIGRRIGQYTINAKIASGGMGSVFRAEQDHPRRTVALKIIQFGAMNAASLRRFEYEAEVLGRLKHPGIVHIFEAGTFDLGDGARPFFAMELIEGEPITEFANRRNLDTTARLQLIVSACQAMQHAHQQGVMHRDLKPGNMLVSAEKSEVKILDFGVARTVDATIGGGHTATGELVGSIRYMSPEQIAGDPVQIDSRCDVYALGVIAYELLAGRLPYDLKTGSVAEVSHAILHDDPTRLGAVNARYRGDLETIIAKAMAREKERRYQSPAEFAADIERFLSDEPIMARPPTAMYQLRKFAQRNRTLVGGVIATILALAIGMALYASEAARARDSAQLALQEADRADAERGKAEAVNTFLTRMLAEIDPNQHGQNVNIAALVDGTAGQIDATFADPLNRAAVHDQVGTIYYNLGLFDKAHEHYTVSLDIRSSTLGEKHPDTIMGFNNLGLVSIRTGRIDDAIANHRLALKGRTLTLGAEDPQTLVSMNNLAAALEMKGQADEARDLFTRALEAQRRVRGPQHPDTLSTTVNLGNLLRRTNQLDAAAELHQRALDGFLATFGEDHVTTLIAMSNLAGTLKRQSKFDDAAPLYRRAIAGLSKALGESHPDALTAMHNLAQLLLTVGAIDEAVDLSRKAAEGFRTASGPQSDALLIALKNYGKCLQAQGESKRAADVLVEVIEGYRARFGDDDPRTIDARRLLAEQSAP